MDNNAKQVLTQFVSMLKNDKHVSDNLKEAMELIFKDYTASTSSNKVNVLGPILGFTDALVGLNDIDNGREPNPGIVHAATVGVAVLGLGKTLSDIKGNNLKGGKKTNVDN